MSDIHFDAKIEKKNNKAVSIRAVSICLLI